MKLLKPLIVSFWIAFFVALVISLIIVGMFFRRIEGTDINKEAFLMNIAPTSVLDVNGEPMAKFYNDRRSLATFEEMPKEIIDGIVSTEDRAFFTHPGYSVKAMTRAAYAIVQADGEIVQGGSTLTQQLMKNTHLNSTKSYERKFWEVVYASVMEQKFTKEEIFEMYVNDFEFRYQAYGIKDAMMTYFGHTFDEFKKLPREERIAKAAVMAGALKNPNIYDPFNKPEITLERRNTVIENMKKTNTITEKEYKLAIEKPLMVLESPKRVFEEEEIKYQELVHYALDEASKKMNLSMKEIMNGGYVIHTSFNTDVYKIMRNEFSNDANFPANASDGTKVQGAMVLVNPKNGELISFTGGREEPKSEEFLGFNRAFMIKKQPGSTIKPVIAYGPALESGKFNPYSSLLDEAGHTFGGGYTPQDWDGGGRGRVTMKEAIRQSWNIPAVWTLQQVGIEYAKDYAKKLGLDLANENTLGIALGGLQQGVNPVQMADSFQVYANNGVRTPAHSIRKIEDANHNLVYKRVTEKKATIKPQNASDMKDMLRTAVASGVAKGAQIPGRQIAGKTGTVEHPLVKGNANSDIWFVGFDEQILASVWMGYDNVSDKRVLHVGSGFAAGFFSKVVGKVLQYYEEHGGLEEPEKLETTPQPDSVSPVVTLNGAAEIKLTVGQAYTELGATATDETEGDLTSKIQVSGTVDTSTPGVYAITYRVLDAALNEGFVERKVVVENEPVVAVRMSLDAQTYDNDKSIYLNWGKVNDNARYQLFKNGSLLQELETNSYLDSSITQGTTYEYYVVAYDKTSGAKIGESSSRALYVNEPAVVPVQPAVPVQPTVPETPVNGENGGNTTTPVPTVPAPTTTTP